MKRASAEKPYLSVCLIVRDCESTLPGSLEACLKSVREVAPDAEIVVVDTMSRDNTPEIAKRYADVFAQYAGPNSDWTSETKFDKPGNPPWDAAAARNKSFQLASGRWLMWIDSDDLLLYEESARDLLKLNGRWRPDAAKERIEMGKETHSLPLIDVLKQLEKDRPELKVLYAPYLYRSDEHGAALEWQDRERVIRNDAHFVWRSTGHEVCVPESPAYFTQPGYLAHLLYRHMKLFKPEDYTFSTERHFNTLIKGYEDGTDRSPRTCLYLANFAHFMCPTRVEEFLQVGLAGAALPLDRYRVHIDLAGERARQGRTPEAYEHFVVAQAIRPDLPDAWYAGAQVAAAVEDWPRASEWYEKAARAKLGQPEANPSMTPRVQRLTGLLQAALCRWRWAKQVEKSGALQLSLEEHKKAEVLLRELMEDPTLAHDRQEAAAYHAFVENERRALEFTLKLRDYHDYLLLNDETQKAALVRSVLPHQHAHGIIAEQLARWQKKIDAHLVSHKAYEDFYADNAATGSVASDESLCLAPMAMQHWRIQWTSQRIQAWLDAHPERKVTVLDYGCFDGLSAIPLMLAIPEHRLAQYIAMDLKRDALDRFKDRLEKLPQLAGYKDKVLFVRGDERSLGTLHADIIVCLEVIEHVQLVGGLIDEFFGALKADGQVIFSTPWGAFDKGLPPGKTAWGTDRDERGHLRAMLPRDMVEAVEVESGRVVDMEIEPRAGGLGASFCAVAKPVQSFSASYKPKPVVFYVAAALWDWNARHVYQTGIGASEETIVYLARELARNDRRSVSVYGPLPWRGVVPGEEVADSVAYWPNDQLHKVKSGKLVVSRQPALGVKLEEAVGDLPKILWLQDAYYNDLNTEVAKHYERIIVVSDWHKQAMHERHGVPLEKMDVAYNFLLAKHFRPATLPERKKHRFIWSSSPDRGLLTLLKMWPAIRQMWPDATLAIFYGWEGCKKLSAINPSWAASFRKLWAQWERLRGQDGIENYGRVNHEQIALEMLKSDIWFYPSTGPGNTFEETGCSNASKARAAGCIPVFHPVAALTETAACEAGCVLPQWGATETFDSYQARCLEALEVAGDRSPVQRSLMMSEALDLFRVETFLDRWQEWLK